MSAILGYALLISFFVSWLILRKGKFDRNNDFGNEKFTSFGELMWVRTFEFLMRRLAVTVVFLGLFLLAIHYFANEVRETIDFFYRLFVSVRSSM